jgi:hypothetical protein
MQWSWNDVLLEHGVPNAGLLSMSGKEVAHRAPDDAEVPRLIGPGRR